MSKTYTNAELNALVAEFSAEFDALVKSEFAKAAPLGEEDSDAKPSKEESSAAESPEEDMSAAPPAEHHDDAASASPSADPAMQAAGGDPVESLKQAYSQLSPEELHQHFLALKGVLMASAGGDHSADATSASASSGLPAGSPPPGPDAAAPLAGEGSKPIDPAATMALKSEFEKELSLVKSERDSATQKIAELEKSVLTLTESLQKMVSQPVRKSVQGKDIEGLLKSEQAPQFANMSKSEITKALLLKARDPKLAKSDRDLINSYYKGSVKVDALSHLLG